MKLKGKHLLLLLLVLVAAYLIYRHCKSTKEGMDMEYTMNLNGYLKNTPNPDAALLMRADDPL